MLKAQLILFSEFHFDASRDCNDVIGRTTRQLPVLCPPPFAFYRNYVHEPFSIFLFPIPSQAGYIVNAATQTDDNSSSTRKNTQACNQSSETQS
jgi:hypothetical protein